MKTEANNSNKGLRCSSLHKNPFLSKYSSNRICFLDKTVAKDTLDARSLESNDLLSNNH